MKKTKNIINYISLPQYFYKGLYLYKKNKWKEALLAFKKAHNILPKNAKILFKLGLCNLKLRNYNEAYLNISKAIEVSPNNKKWLVQLHQAKKLLENNKPVITSDTPIRIKNISDSLEEYMVRKTLLLIPSDYNHRVLADISSFIDIYKNQFNIYIIVRDTERNISYENGYTIVQNGTSYSEYLKFTADYVIDAGSMNYYYRITDRNIWISVWHGIPYKKMFIDVDKNHLPTAIRYSTAYDYMISMSDFYSETFLRNSMRYRGKILQLGCSKIDNLLNKIHESNIDRIKLLYKNLKINKDRKVVVFSIVDNKENIDFNKILNLLGGEYTFIIRTNNHKLNKTYNKNIIFDNCIKDLDLLLLGDLLISNDLNLISKFDHYDKDVIVISFDTLLIKNSESRTIKYKDEMELSEKIMSLNINRNSYEKLPDYIHKNHVKYLLGIPRDKKIVLYAPTFRRKGGVTLPFKPDSLLKNNDEYVIITKMHYLNYLTEEYSNVIDCTNYSDMSELMNISDILISDYSSLVLDYAVLNKPIILFQYDYDEYMKNRGVYFNFLDYIPQNQIVKKEEELYTIHFSRINNKNTKLVEEFYPIEDGCSTARIANALQLNSSYRKFSDIIFLVNELNQIGGVHTFLKNMAKFYKEKYNSRIFVIGIREFAETNSEFHKLESEYIDFKLSSQYLNGACKTILQNTSGIVISLQFSAHLHFQTYLNGANTILMFHGDVKDMISRELYAPHLDWLNKGTLFNYSKLLVLTESSVNLLKPHLCEAVSNKLGFIHNSIDAEFKIIEEKQAQENVNAAIITRFESDKNIWAIIDLGKEILNKKSNIILNVYGDGSLKDKFIQKVNENNLNKIVNLKGYQSNKDIIFENNSCLLIMSKSEGFPLVLLEAYSYGKPVIAFNSFTSAKDIIEHKKTGFLVEYGNFTEIVESINKLGLISVKDIRAKYNSFTNGIVFNKWNNLIQEIFGDL